MTTKFERVAVRCPIHKVQLVRIPEAIANDIVACPYCGIGGTYEQIIKKRMKLTASYVPRGLLNELLRTVRHPSK